MWRSRQELVYCAATHQKMATIEHEQSGIIDPGPRTFDWLVARGMRLVLKASDAVTRGVSHVPRDIANDIGTGIGTPYTDLDAIDRALRTGQNPMGSAGPISMLFEMNREDNPRLYDDLARFNKGMKRVNRLRFLAHEGLLAQHWLLVPTVAGAAAALPLPAAPAAGGFDFGESTVTNQMFGQPLSE